MDSIILYENGKEIKVQTPYLLDSKSYDIDLSIVVPAYNEEARLPKMMKETIDVNLCLDQKFTIVLGEKTGRKKVSF